MGLLYKGTYDITNTRKRGNEMGRWSTKRKR